MSPRADCTGLGSRLEEARFGNGFPPFPGPCGLGGHRAATVTCYRVAVCQSRMDAKKKKKLLECVLCGPQASAMLRPLGKGEILVPSAIGPLTSQCLRESGERIFPSRCLGFVVRNYV